MWLDTTNYANYANITGPLTRIYPIYTNGGVRLVEPDRPVRQSAAGAQLLQNTNASAKAGVMMRETLTAGSANAFMTASATKGTFFSRRTVKSGTTTSTAGTLSGAPIWLKLERVGNTLNGYT